MNDVTRIRQRTRPIAWPVLRQQYRRRRLVSKTPARTTSRDPRASFSASLAGTRMLLCGEHLLLRDDASDVRPATRGLCVVCAENPLPSFHAVTRFQERVEPGTSYEAASATLADFIATGEIISSAAAIEVVANSRWPAARVIVKRSAVKPALVLTVVLKEPS